MTPADREEFDHAAVTLRDYIDMRIDAINLGITKSEIAMEQRFQSVNELRAMANDIASRGLTRAEYNSAHAALEDKIDSVQRLVYIGFGVAITLQILLGAAVILWRSHSG